MEGQPVKTQFLKEALANTLGSIGQSKGPLKRAMTSFQKTVGVWDKYQQELIASYPSRSRFQRGFAWDEGFHLLLICQWSEDLCIDIMQSWALTIDENGWIAGEQARGNEALYNIPPEYQTVDENMVLPPSFVMPLQILLDRATDSEKSTQALKRLYTRWARQFYWYEKQFKNSQIPCTFSYHRRTATLNEQSGMSDYPRGNMVHENLEIHVDIQSQMIEYALTMSKYASLVGDNLNATDFQSKAECFQKQL